MRTFTVQSPESCFCTHNRKEDFPLAKEDRIRDHLSKLDTCKSMGPDRIHSRALGHLVDVIAKPFSIIFKRSWRTGEVCEDWKKADVTPVFRKGKKEDLGNYKAVRLTSTAWKGDGTAHSRCHL